jgi:uridine kinase
MVYIVGIAGGSASGKTTILSLIKNNFRTGEVAVLSQDNYYLPRHEQERDARGEVNFDLPTAIDRAAYARDLDALLGGDVVRRREYTYNNALATPSWVEVIPAPVVVVEGLFVFHYDEISRRMHLKVYVEASEEVKLQRRLRRDALERGYPEADVHYRWQHHVLPCYHRYLRPYRDGCDLIIANNHSHRKAVEVLIDHLRLRVEQARLSANDGSA